MQPTPPIALKPSAMSSLPESWTKSVAAGERAGRETRARLPVASLTPTTLAMRRAAPSSRPRCRSPSAPARCRARSGGRPLRRSRRNGRRSPPGWAGCNKAARASAASAPASLAARVKLDRVGGVVGAAAGDDRHPAGRRLDADLDHPAMLGRSRASPIRRSCRRAQGRDSLRRSASRRSRERRASSNASSRKRRHQSRDRPPEHHCLLHLGTLPDLGSATGHRGGRSWPDKEGGVILSSMHRKAGLILLLGVSAAAVAAHGVAPECAAQSGWRVLRPVGAAVQTQAAPAAVEPGRGRHRALEQPPAERLPALLLLRLLPRRPSRLAGRGGDAAHRRAAAGARGGVARRGHRASSPPSRR